MNEVDIAGPQARRMGAERKQLRIPAGRRNNLECQGGTRGGQLLPGAADLAGLLIG